MKTTLIFFIFLLFSVSNSAQSSPIQAGASPSSNDLYHSKNIGLSTKNPNAYLHILQKDGEISETLLKIEGTSLDISELLPGVYYLTSIRGNYKESIKFIKI